MSNIEIIEDLARRRVVERICDGVTRRGGRPESKDLAQHVYEELLRKEPGKLVCLENLESYIYKIAYMSWNASGTQFFRKYRSYGLRTDEFDENGVGGPVSEDP